MVILEDLCCLKEEQISRIPNIWLALYLLELTGVQKAILECILQLSITAPGLNATWKHLVDPGLPPQLPPQLKYISLNCLLKFT